MRRTLSVASLLLSLAAGEIRSNNYQYTFTADIYGDAGYGDMVTHYDNRRVRIKIQSVTNGFSLTVNPFGPGSPSTYDFKKV